MGLLTSAGIGLGAVGLTFGLTGGFEALRTADELRGRSPSNLELFGHFFTEQPHILHDIIQDPREDGVFTEADGTLQGMEGKLFFSAIVCSLGATGISGVRKKLSS